MRDKAMRDPRITPQPGDEVFGPVIKVKVLEVTVAEEGVRRIKYTAAAKHLEYHPNHSTICSLERWKKFSLAESECKVDDAAAVEEIERRMEGKAK